MQTEPIQVFSPPLLIISRRISELKANPHNARTHSKRQISQIIASIRQFGFLNPLIIDKNGVLIAGHGRVEAAKLCGLDMVPTVMIST